MSHPKVVTPILPRTNNSPKAKSNRIAAIMRSVRDDDSFFEIPEASNIVGTLQHVMRVLDDCHNGQHPELIKLEIEECPLCFAMRMCAAELLTLQSHATETLAEIGGAL